MTIIDAGENNLCIKLKECNQCRAKLQPNSKRCSSCGAYQSKYVNYVLLFTPVISVVLALIALGFSIYPKLHDFFSKKHAVVKLEVLDISEGVLELYAHNTGNKTAVLGDINISYDKMEGGVCELIDLKFDVSRVIKSGEELIIKTKTNHQVPDMLLPQHATPKTLGVNFSLTTNQEKLVNDCTVFFSHKSSNTTLVPTEIRYECK